MCQKSATYYIGRVNDRAAILNWLFYYGRVCAHLGADDRLVIAEMCFIFSGVPFLVLRRRQKSSYTIKLHGGTVTAR